MKISQEDTILIKNFYLSKHYDAWRMLSEFPNNGWKVGNIVSSLKRIRWTDKIVRQPGSGRPRIRRVAVEDLMLSQEDEKLEILSLSYLECTFGIIQFQSMKQEGKLVRSAWRQDVLLWGDSWPTFACLLRINYLILCISSRRPPGAVLHSSNEPGELSQWLCHADSTINIVLDIIIIIIIIIVLFSFPACDNLWEYIVYIAEFCRHRTIACCGQSGSMFISRLYAGFGKHNILYK